MNTLKSIIFSAFLALTLSACSADEDKPRNWTLDELNEVIQSDTGYTDTIPEIAASCSGDIGCYVSECRNPSGEYSYLYFHSFDTDVGIASVHTVSFDGSRTCELTSGVKFGVNPGTGSIWSIELESGTADLGTLALTNVYYQDGFIFGSDADPVAGLTYRMDFEKVGDQLCLSEGSVESGWPMKILTDTPLGINYENCLNRFVE